MLVLDIRISEIDVEDVFVSKSFLESMQEHGQKQPVLLTTQDNDRYTIREGRRRVKAAQILKWATVEALVKHWVELDDDAQEVDLLVTNFHRSPNPVGELKAVQALMKKKYTMDEIIHMCRLDKPKFQRIKRLSLLNDLVLSDLEKGKISLQLALRMARLPREKQKQLLEQCVNEGTKVNDKAVEKAVRDHNLGSIQDEIMGMDDIMPAINPMVMQFEQVAGLVMAGRHVPENVSRAIDVLRTYLRDQVPAVPVGNGSEEMEAQL